MTGIVSLKEKQAWFALVDAEHCRLLCGRRTKQGTLHIEEYEALENTFPEREHQRPQTGDGITHDVEEKERRFAGRIVEKLQESAMYHGIDHLVIFAPPHMLGILRKESSGLFAGHIEEIERNLMWLHAGQLAEHPMIRDMARAMQES